MLSPLRGCRRLFTSTRARQLPPAAIRCPAAKAPVRTLSSTPVSGTAAMSHHPSALRNREPIAAKIAEVLGAAAAKPLRALEIASGTGAHLELLAEKFPAVQWQPSEYVPAAEDGEEFRTEEQLATVGKIGSRAEMTELEVIDSFGTKKFKNVLPAVALDASLPVAEWPEAAVAGGKPTFDLMFISNVFHITPWGCTVGTLTGAGAVLKLGGRLLTYGPYKVDGKFTTESNEAFHKVLQGRNPRWGYRDVAEVAAEGAKHGLHLHATHEMPANNLMLEFVRVAAGVAAAAHTSGTAAAPASTSTGGGAAAAAAAATPAEVGDGVAAPAAAETE